MTALDYTIPRAANNAEGQLDSAINATSVTFVLGSGEGDNFPTTYKDNTTSAGDSTTLNFTGISALSVASVGDFIENLTDGSHAFVISVDTNSITTTKLKGGSDNTWDNGDEFAVNRFAVTLNARDDGGNITKSEIVLIDSRSSDTLTTVLSQRAYGGGTAQTFEADDYVSLFVTEETAMGIFKALAEIKSEKADYSTVVELFNARNVKEEVVAASTADLTLTTDVEDGDTLDGITLATGDRILIKNQTDQTENGIYVVAASGAPSRSDDADTGTELTNAIVAIRGGTSNADTLYMQTADDPIIGTDNIVWAQVGASLEKASQAEAEAGANDTKYMTPLKVVQTLRGLTSAVYTSFIKTRDVITALQDTDKFLFMDDSDGNDKDVAMTLSDFKDDVLFYPIQIPLDFGYIGAFSTSLSSTTATEDSGGLRLYQGNNSTTYFGNIFRTINNGIADLNEINATFETQEHYLTDSSNGKMWLGLCSGVLASSGSLDLTNSQIGFYFVDNTGLTLDIYATCGDGSSNTNVLLATAVPNSEHITLHLQKKGSNARFRLIRNGVSAPVEANITTNLPTVLSRVCMSMLSGGELIVNSANITAK